MKTTLLISALAVSLTGCVDPIDSIDTDDEAPQHEKLSANGMAPWALAGTTVGVSKLTSTYTNGIGLGSAGGRWVLDYLISCALSPGNSMTYQYYQNGTSGAILTNTVQGSVGLFNSWKTTVPTLAQQRAISSCVLARMNETGTNVTISIRGAIYPNDPGEVLDYTVREGAFFGNIFAGTDYYWGACDAPGVTLSTRQCAQDGHCSMSWAGDCTTACAGTGDYYTSCTGANGVSYAAPGTVYLYTYAFPE